MPGSWSAPSLAESWQMAKDGLSADFTLRSNAKFHNGDPVTGDDVKFSFERYRGGAAKVLKDNVKEIRRDKPSLMPSYKTTLNAKEMENLVAYLSSLRGQQ